MSLLGPPFQNSPSNCVFLPLVVVTFWGVQKVVWPPRFPWARGRVLCSRASDARPGRDSGGAEGSPVSCLPVLSLSRSTAGSFPLSIRTSAEHVKIGLF